MTDPIWIFPKNKSYVLVSLIILFFIGKGFTIISFVYYLFPLFIFSLLLIDYRNIYSGIIKNKLLIMFIPFFIWALVSSSWSLSPIFSLEKAIYFLFLLISAYILNKFAIDNDIKLQEIFMLPSVVIIPESLISLILKIPFDFWSGGNGLGLKGFSSHQNMLGSIMLFLIPFLNLNLFKMLEEKLKNRKEFLLIVILNIFGLFVMLLTFSRGAIFSYFLFIFSFFLFHSTLKKTIIYLSTFLLLIMILSMINPVRKYLQYSLYKGNEHLFNSRTVMYNMSFIAAQAGGIVGLGYGISDQGLFDPGLCKISHGIMVREKGSSALALIEEIGWIGFILFYFPQSYLLMKLIQEGKFKKNKKRQHQKNIYLCFSIALMIALIIHSQIEAWGVGVGSVMLPLYLIILFDFYNQIIPFKEELG